MPVAVKDLCWTADAPTAFGTTIYRGFQTHEDGTVVKRLREAGAVILGKVQLTEGALTDHHPDIDPPVNPWNPAHWTGVSSSGSGVRRRRACATAPSAPTPAAPSAFRRRPAA